MEILYSDAAIAVVIKPVGLDSEQEVPQAIREKRITHTRFYLKTVNTS